MNSNCATTIMASQLIVEPYQVTESRIKQVIDILSDRGDDNLNLAAAAREFRVPVKRLRARWARQQSKQERPSTNKRLSEDEELAVCLYLDRLEAIGTAARKQMITACANDILRHYLAEAVEKATRTGCSDFNKVGFLHALHSIREQTFKKNTILTAFRNTGLLPFAPEIVLKQLPPRPTTPSPSTPPSLRRPSPSPPHTPLTIRSLKRQRSMLEEVTADLSPTIQRRLKKFMHGSLVQAQLGAQALEDLEHTQAAQKARTARQKGGR